MENQDPLISCICVTSKRPLLLQRAIACFERQTYRNRELVISFPKSDQETRDLLLKISLFSDISLLVMERPDEENLGSARNRAIEQANGTYICVWDDDDWYHNKRIEYQYEAIKGSIFRASVIQSILLCDFQNKETFFSPCRMWEGTLLCEKEILQSQLYLEQERGEDTAVVFNLHLKNILFNLVGAPFMYIYIYHGNNTWGENHFNSYFLQAVAMDEKINQQVEELTSLEYYIL